MWITCCGRSIRYCLTSFDINVALCSTYKPNKSITPAFLCGPGQAHLNSLVSLNKLSELTWYSHLYMCSWILMIVCCKGNVFLEGEILDETVPASIASLSTAGCVPTMALGMRMHHLHSGLSSLPYSSFHAPTCKSYLLIARIRRIVFKSNNTKTDVKVVVDL